MAFDPEIRRTGSAIVYENRWMTVREDRIVRADGSPGIYGVVEKSDYVIVAAVGDGLIHLVEQYRYPVGARFWEMPQGSWEGRKIDPLALAAAELREETGLIAGSMIHAGRLYQAYGYATQACDVFLAGELIQGSPEREIEEAGMIAQGFALPEFERMIVDGLIPDSATVAAYGLLRLKGLL
jgi:ADP-ribose pyrophosphatase